MRRTEHFLISRALYAVDLTGLSRLEVGKVEGTGAPLYRYEIPAVWFKRRRSIDTANAGHLWDISVDRHEEGDEAAARRFLETTLTDGRYGGSCRSRWDGERLWSDPYITLAAQNEDLKMLRGMLDTYPEIPAGFDGWWTFH